MARATHMNKWVVSGLTGVTAGIIFGFFIQSLNLFPLIGSIVGFESVIGGVIVHLIASAVFGILYAALLSFQPLQQYASRITTGAGIGFVYGLLLWIIVTSIAFPVLLNVTQGLTQPVPDFNLQLLVGHLVYGLVLGGIYGAALDPQELE